MMHPWNDFFDDNGDSFRFAETAIDLENLDEDMDPSFAVNQNALIEGLRDLFREGIKAKSIC